MEKLINEVVGNVGYEKLKDDQRDAIAAFLQGKDVFVSLPTDSGKSLCFVLIPSIVDLLKSALSLPSNHCSMMVIISPLVSLMMDQVEKYSSK